MLRVFFCNALEVGTHDVVVHIEAVTDVKVTLAKDLQAEMSVEFY